MGTRVERHTLLLRNTILCTTAEILSHYDDQDGTFVGTHMKRHTLLLRNTILCTIVEILPYYDDQEGTFVGTRVERTHCHSKTQYCVHLWKYCPIRMTKRAHLWEHAWNDILRKCVHPPWILALMLHLTAHILREWQQCSRRRRYADVSPELMRIWHHTTTMSSAFVEVATWTHSERTRYKFRWFLISRLHSSTNRSRPEATT